MSSNLQLSIYGELFVIDLDRTMYFEADDHYTHVYYTTGVKFLVPFGLSRVEAEIGRMQRDADSLSRMLRVGRSYVVNLRWVLHVNVIKQNLVLFDERGQTHVLSVSKAVLRNLMNTFQQLAEIREKNGGVHE